MCKEIVEFREELDLRQKNDVITGDERYISWDNYHSGQWAADLGQDLLESISSFRRKLSFRSISLAKVLFLSRHFGKEKNSILLLGTKALTGIAC
jgi:hypothetical protein